MKINYNYTREQKKRMVKAIGEALDEKPVYLGVPSCAYKIAEFTVTRDGNLEFPDDMDPEIINGLLDALEEAGFAFPENEEHAVSVDTEVCTDENGSVTTEGGAEELDQLETPTELTISLPIMESSALDRLQKLVDSKAMLIRKALDADQLTIQSDGDKVFIPLVETHANAGRNYSIHGILGGAVPHGSGCQACDCDGETGGERKICFPDFPDPLGI